MQGSSFSSVIFRGRSDAGVLILLGYIQGRLMRGSSFSSVIFRGPHSPRLYSGDGLMRGSSFSSGIFRGRSNAGVLILIQKGPLWLHAFIPDQAVPRPGSANPGP